MSKSFIWIPIKRYKCCSGPNGMTWYEHMKHKPSYHVYRDQFNTASWHHVDIAPDFCAIRSVKQGEKFKLRDLVTWRSKQATAATGQARSLFFDITSSVRFTIFLSQLWELLLNYILYTNREIILHDVFVQLQSIFNSTNINHGQSYPICGFWLKYQPFLVYKRLNNEDIIYLLLHSTILTYIATTRTL